MHHNIKVSTIICTHNRSDLLPRAIDSVKNQTHKNIEIIIVDDASKSFHKRIIKKLDYFKDPNLKLISLSKNVGVAKATNIGFKASKGEFIALLGDDDYWVDKEKISKQLNIFLNDKNKLLGVVGTWWKDVLPDQKMISHAPKIPKNPISKFLIGGSLICGSTPLIPRDIWKIAGGLDENMKRGTDSDLFRRIVLKGYDVKNIEEFSVLCDSLPICMTNLNTREKLKIAIITNLYLIKKYRIVFLKKPYALLIRAIKIIKLTLKLIYKLFN